MNRAFRPYRLEFAQAIQTAKGLWTHREGFLLRETDVSSEDVRFAEVAPLPAWGTEDWETLMPLLKKWEAGEEPATLLAKGRLPALAFALNCLSSPEKTAEGAVRIPLAGVVTEFPQASDLHAFQAKGYRCLKAKINGTHPETYRHWQQLAGEMPPDLELRWDANGSIPPDEVDKWLDLGMRIKGFSFLEEPAPFEKMEKAKITALARTYPWRIAWDESLQVAFGNMPEGAFVAVIKPACLGRIQYIDTFPAPWRRLYSSAWEGPVGRHRVACIHAADPEALPYPGLDSPFRDFPSTGPEYNPGVFPGEAFWNYLTPA